MGFIYDLVHEINILDRAMEASEDITDEVTANTDKMMGRDTGLSTTTRKSSSATNNGEIDTNTDNILGSSDSDDVGGDDGDSPIQDNDQTDENSEIPNDNDAGDGMNNQDDLSNTDDISNSLKEDNSFEKTRKIKLHGQYLTMFKTIDADIKLISEYIPKITNEMTFHTLSNVNSNLTQCKEYIYNILTMEYEKTSYAILLKKYIALNRVYDLCIKILERYFEFKKDNP